MCVCRYGEIGMHEMHDQMHPNYKIMQLFCWSMTPFIIVLSCDHNTLLVVGNLPINPLVARQWLTNNIMIHTLFI